MQGSQLLSKELAGSRVLVSEISRELRCRVVRFGVMRCRPISRRIEVVGSEAQDIEIWGSKVKVKTYR